MEGKEFKKRWGFCRLPKACEKHQPNKHRTEQEIRGNSSTDSIQGNEDQGGWGLDQLDLKSVWISEGKLQSSTNWIPEQIWPFSKSWGWKTIGK